MRLYFKAILAALRNPEALVAKLMEPKLPVLTVNKVLPRQIIKYFIISRLLFICVGGFMRPGPLPDPMHLMSRTLMETNFWQNLWYMHSQPPLFNILSWLILKLAPFGQYILIAWPLFMAMGLAMALMLYRIMVEFKLPPRLAALVSILFTVSSNTLLFEAYYLYSYPLTVSLVASVYFLQRFLKSERTTHALLSFTFLAAPCLLHSMYHLLFLIVAILGAFILASGLRAKVLLAAILPLALVTGVYAKNYYNVGQFAASTWGGWTIANITYYFPLSAAEKQQYIADGTLSPAAAYTTFDALENYPSELWQHTPTGIAILDETRKDNGAPNFHNLGVITVSNQAGHDAIALLKSHPAIYWRGVQSAAYFFFLPPSEWLNTRAKKQLKWYDRMWSIATSGRLAWNTLSMSQLLRERFIRDKYIPSNFFAYIPYNGPLNFPYTAPFILLALAITGLVTATRQTLKGSPQAATYWLIIYIVGFTTAASILLDIGENQRYRYYMSPELALIFATLLHTALARYLKSRK